MITVVSNNTLLRIVRWKVVHHLGKDRPAFVHAPLSMCLTRPGAARGGEKKTSNRKRGHSLPPFHLIGLTDLVSKIAGH